MTKVVGAVAAPIEVAGLVTAVPPEILDVAPTTPVPSSDQVVTKVNTVLVAEAVVRMNSGVYGEVALFNWNMVTGEPVRAYQPVDVAKVVCVPPDPPIRVVPV